MQATFDSMEKKSQLPRISTKHLEGLMGRYGIYQHAIGKKPRLGEGYCTDDNTRAVQVMLNLQPFVLASGKKKLEGMVSLCWQFVREAEFEPGKFHNFRSNDGVWLETTPSGDMYARILRCCVAVILLDQDLQHQQQAIEIIQRILKFSSHSIVSARAVAETLIALTELPPGIIDDQTLRTCLELYTQRLVSFWHAHSSVGWPWFEEKLTYANAILPHGLWQAVNTLGQFKTYGPIIKSSAGFLIETTIKDGMFTPIGNIGWYGQNSMFPLYDQQPIEAGTMLDFLLEYGPPSENELSLETILAPYLWFFGQNSQKKSLVDSHDGACCDGLNEDGPNKNYGAESLLAYLWSEIRVRQSAPEIIQAAAEKLRALNQ